MVADEVRKAVQEGREAVIGRVVAVKGFSTLPLDELVAIDNAGNQHGDILGRPGAEKMGAAAQTMLDPGRGSPDGGLQTVTVEIHGPQVAELGLSCGGQAEVLLQSASAIPSRLWDLLAARAPVALITRVEGAGAGRGALVVDREGHSWGSVTSAVDPDPLRASAVALLSAGRSAIERVEDEDGALLIEAWVPAPRLVVVGAGEMVDAIAAQAGLLGWDARATESVADLDGLFEWAGATAALIVLTHDPHVDAPALSAGLAKRIPYVGAMGSRGTQSRRLSRLAADGVPAEDLDRIHRPIGLNLGGRRASEVALAIAAEVLACHCGRDARPLRDTTGSIHG
jgi:xanthine dehydrogenase accessory factor